MIKILVDSASDIDLAEAEKLKIELVSMKITFDDGEYLDGVDLSREQFFDKLAECKNLPHTSQITPYEFAQKFKEMTADGSDVVAITMSSKLSGTFAGAASAAAEFNGKVRVVDSLNASCGERILCLYAVRLRDGGRSADEIAAELERAKGRINVMAVLDTLTYLKKGGRISSLTAAAGELLSVKPVIGVVGGEVKMLGKAIGSKKSNNLLNKLIKEKGVDFSLPYGVMWSGGDNSMLMKYVEDSGELWKSRTDCLPAYMIGSTIGTHIGPGAIGVAFFEKG